MATGVEKIVGTTKAIRWWIDEQIAQGKSDAEIEAMLPFAVGFIVGRVPLARLLEAVA